MDDAALSGLLSMGESQPMGKGCCRKRQTREKKALISVGEFWFKKVTSGSKKTWVFRNSLVLLTMRH